MPPQQDVGAVVFEQLGREVPANRHAASLVSVTFPQLLAAKMKSRYIVASILP